MGMSNYNKNLFVGLGGKDAIDLSHFIGACYGMERMMGRADNPLRRILNRAADDFLQKLPLVRVTWWRQPSRLKTRAWKLVAVKLDCPLAVLPLPSDFSPRTCFHPPSLPDPLPRSQVYILTVIGPAGNSGGLALRGLFIGDDEECFNAAAKLSLDVNFTLVPRPIQKVSPPG